LAGNRESGMNGPWQDITAVHRLGCTSKHTHTNKHYLHHTKRGEKNGTLENLRSRTWPKVCEQPILINGFGYANIRHTALQSP